MEIRTQTAEQMHTWTITTQAEGRIKSRSTMTHTIEAATEADAIFEARQAHIWKGRVAMDRSIFVVSVTEEIAPDTEETKARVEDGEIGRCSHGALAAFCSHEDCAGES